MPSALQQLAKRKLKPRSMGNTALQASLERNAAKVAQLLREQGSADLDMLTGEAPGEGYLLNLPRDEGLAYTFPDAPGPAGVRDYVRGLHAQTDVGDDVPLEELVKQPRRIARPLGRKRHVLTGRGSTLDVGEVYPFGAKLPDEALALPEGERWRMDPGIRQPGYWAGETGQPSIETLGTNPHGSPSLIPTQSWMDWADRNLTGRVVEQGTVGRDAMLRAGADPEHDWWDLHGGVTEDVLGDYTELFGRYNAAASPNQSVRQHMGGASEYLRRHLAGEDIIQPDWRTPSGAQMPLQFGHRKNLLRAQAGVPLSGPKVRAMDAMQFPGSQVRERLYPEGTFDAAFDTHWSKLMENPNDPQGPVFLGPRAEVYGRGGKDLSRQTRGQAALEEASREMGTDPRYLGAWAWEGIRETIKNDAARRQAPYGFLYDTPYAAAPIAASATSAARTADDVFKGLFEGRMKDTGLNAAELTRRIRAGQENVYPRF